MFIDEIGRRGALGLIGGATALAAAPSTAQAAVTPAPAGKMTNEQRLRTFMLMRAALDDRLVVFWIRGQYFGLVEGEITPLFGVLAATLTRYKQHPDGGYTGARGEISYILDPESGEVADKVRNPYTGETIETPVRGYPPSPLRIHADLTFEIADHPGAKLTHDVTGIHSTGGDVWLSEVSAARTQLPGGKLSLYNEMLTYQASEADLARRGVKQVLSNISFTNTVSWRSWMKMGDRPGHMLATGAGKYVKHLPDLPKPWLDATRKHQPSLISDPFAFLAPVWDGLP